MNPTLRNPRESDRGRIRAAVDVALYLSSPPKGTTLKYSTVSHLCDDPGHAVDIIIQNKVDCFIIDESYLLVYSVAKPWYCKDTLVLAEDLVLRIGTGGSFKSVIRTLDIIAEDYDCNAIIVGGALARSSRAITRLYQRHGFDLETDIPQLTKRRK